MPILSTTLENVCGWIASIRGDKTKQYVTKAPEDRADRLVKETGLAVAIPELFEIMEHWPHWAKREDASNWVPFSILSDLDCGGDAVNQSWVQWRAEGTLFRISWEASGIHDDDRTYTVTTDDAAVCALSAHSTDGGYGPWEYGWVSSLIVGPWIDRLIAFHAQAKVADRLIAQRSEAELRAERAARFDLGD